MTLVFADREALRVALGRVPAELLARPIAYGARADGAILVDESGLPAAVRDDLVALGVTVAADPTPSTASSWAELIPLEPEEHGDVPAEVLFAVAPDRLVPLAAELVRLGAGRIRWCAGQAGGLIRAERAPFWTVAGATEPSSAVRAHRAVHGESVWVELGFRHPLADRVRAPAGALLLLGRDGWRTAPDGPWSDPLDSAEIPVSLETPWVVVRPPPLRIPLALTRGPARPAVLWVASVDAVEAFVQATPSGVLDRLDFAVAGERAILRARVSASPPSIELEAAAFAAHPTWAALHVPVGRALSIPLEPERLRRVVPLGAGEIGWLADGAGIRVERIAEAAFRPLSEWVEYVVDRDADALAPWIAGVAFALDPIRAVADPDTSREPASVADAGEAERPVREPRRRRGRKLEGPPPPHVADLPVAAYARPDVGPRPAEAELSAAQAAFLADDSPADSPGRAAAWAELARLHEAAGARVDGVLCRVRAAWLTGDAGDWARSSSDWRAALAGEDPSREEVFAVAAALAAGNIGSTSLHDVASWLDRHDAALDLRSFWLAWRALADATGDPLRLARARDRVFASLRSGLPPSSDLPTFVRLAGLRDGGADVASALERFHAKFRTTRRARSPVEAPEPFTLAFVDLTFAWAFARVGRPEDARRLLAAARGALTHGDAIYELACAAFAVRIEQALAGLPRESRLPSHLEGTLKAFGRFERYKVDRLRQASSVLEPTAHLDPFHAFNRGDVDRGEWFAPLRGLVDPGGLARSLAQIATRPVPAADRARVFSSILELTSSLPPALARPLIVDLRARAATLPDDARLPVLGETLRVAVACEAPDLAVDLARDVAEGAARLWPAHPAAAAALDAAVRSLRQLAGKAGGPSASREALVSLLRLSGSDSASDLASGRKTSNRSLSSDPRLWTSFASDARLSAAPSLATALGPGDAGPPLLARLTLAPASLALGEPGEAYAAVAEGFRVLDQPGLPPGERTALWRAIARVAAGAPRSFAVECATRLVDHLARTSDSFNTNSHFCISVIELADCVASCVVSDEIGLGPHGRRLVDDDERVLRRGVHRDLQARSS